MYESSSPRTLTPKPGPLPSSDPGDHLRSGGPLATDRADRHSPVDRASGPGLPGLVPAAREPQGGLSRPVVINLLGGPGRPRSSWTTFRSAQFPKRCYRVVETRTLKGGMKERLPNRSVEADVGSADRAAGRQPPSAAHGRPPASRLGADRDRRPRGGPRQAPPVRLRRPGGRPQVRPGSNQGGNRERVLPDAPTAQYLRQDRSSKVLAEWRNILQGIRRVLEDRRGPRTKREIKAHEELTRCARWSADEAAPDEFSRLTTAVEASCRYSRAPGNLDTVGIQPLLWASGQYFARALEFLNQRRRLTALSRPGGNPLGVAAGGARRLSPPTSGARMSHLPGGYPRSVPRSFGS